MATVDTRNLYYGQAAKALGYKSGDLAYPDKAKKTNDYAKAFGDSLDNPLYLQTAEKLGIKNYNSIDDYNKVLSALTGGLAINSSAPSVSDDSNSTRLPAPNDGTYNNIITNTNFEGNLGAKQEAIYNNMQPDNSGGNPIQVDSIVTAADQKLAALAPAAPAATDAAAIAPAADPVADAAATQAAAIKAQSDAQMKALQDLMIQQDQAYKQQLELQQQQIASANAAYAEQRRQSDALSRAYIPAPLPTAASPIFGMSSSGSKSSSSLSSLAIGGKQKTGSSLSGLQIA